MNKLVKLLEKIELRKRKS